MIRAYVTVAPMAYNLAVSLVRHYEDGTGRAQVLRFASREGAGTFPRWEPIEPGDAVEPSFSLALDEAQALLAALHSHFQGVDDQRALRADYDAERGRVDKLLGVVSEIARGRPTP